MSTRNLINNCYSRNPRRDFFPQILREEEGLLVARAGCTEIKGKPFWGTCPTYACAQEHKVKHCGSCGEFPCDKFVEMFDPNDPEGRRSAVYRAGIEAYRARHGDEKAVELIKKTAKKH